MANQLEIKIHHLSLLSETINTFAKSIMLKISIDNVTDKHIDEILEIIKNNKGKSLLKINIFDTKQKTSVQMFSKKYKVNITDLVKSLEDMEVLEYKIN